MRQLFTFLVAFIFLSGCLGGFNYWVDPYGYREPNHVGPAMEEANQEWPSIAARYAKGDAILMGSSVSNKAEVAEFTKHLGADLLNLADLGNTAFVQSQVLDCAFSYQGQRPVYWELFSNIWGGAHRLALGRDFHCTPTLKSYLNYFTKEALFDSFRALVSAHPVRIDTSLVAPIHHDTEIYGKEQVDRSLHNIVINWQRLGVHALDLSAVLDAVDNDLLPTVRRYPDVKFTFFFPPISVYALLALDIEMKRTEHSYGQVKREVIRHLISEPNVEIIDMQWDQSILTDWSMYRDIMHYSAVRSNWVADQLRSAPRITSLEDADRTIERMEMSMQAELADYMANRAPTKNLE